MTMNRFEFRQLLENKILILDGAYGTTLNSTIHNLPFSEEANVLYPDTVFSLHKAYINAGADIIKTNTFGIFHLVKNRKITLEYGLKLLEEGVKIGLKAVKDRNAFCFVSIGPMSDGVFEYTSQVIDFFEEFFYKASLIALNSGIDGFLLETFSDFLELKTVVNVIRDLSLAIPIIAQFTLGSNGKTIQGAEATNCGAFLEVIDCDVAGLNCSTGALEMANNFEDFSYYLTKPLSASPNAGFPLIKEGRVFYPDKREEFKKSAEIFLKNGARILGSCCGSNPEYTRVLKEVVLKCKHCFSTKKKKDFLVSRDAIVDFSKTSFLPIGERLNLLGNSTFKKNYLKDRKSAIEIELNRQLTAGAQCVDVNLDLVARENPQVAKEDILLLQGLKSPIISGDTLYPDVMEKFSRYSACSLIYNSTDLTFERFKKIASLYKRYGGKIIVLLMSGKRVPKTLNERLKGIDILKSLLERFEIPEDDILIDPLALTLAESVDNYFFVEKIIEKSPFKTVIGLSNFSHGLPDRSKLNSFLLTHLLRKGLTASILDVSDPPISSVIVNHTALFDKRSFNLGNKEGVNFSGLFSDWGVFLLKGESEELIEKLKNELNKGQKASYLLENGLIDKMEQIGSFFEKGVIYLSQLLIAADTMKKVFEFLKPYLEHEFKGGKAEKNNKKIIFFTVQNDVHDIGKNIVLTVLKSFGYSVFDGGIDRSPEEIVKEVQSSNAKIVGLSALMTTSLPFMKETVRVIKEKLPDVKVIVGGAVVTKRFAEEIGADGYGKNAFEAVNIVRGLL